VENAFLPTVYFEFQRGHKKRAHPTFEFSESFTMGFAITIDFPPPINFPLTLRLEALVFE